VTTSSVVNELHYRTPAAWRSLLSNELPRSPRGKSRAQFLSGKLSPRTRLVVGDRKRAPDGCIAVIELALFSQLFELSTSADTHNERSQLAA
jgi:hypothetical protein